MNSESLTCLVNSVNEVGKVTEDFGVKLNQNQFVFISSYVKIWKVKFVSRSLDIECKYNLHW